jgi:hypothetical protein
MLPGLCDAERGLLAGLPAEEMKIVIWSHFGATVDDADIFQGLQELSSKGIIIRGDEVSNVVHVMDMKNPLGMRHPRIFETARDLFMAEFFFCPTNKQKG